ncbi:pyruvate kinase [Candidatus Thermokryptus mobilis]|uniref:Pyruvate kinase n=1 Tax=Candidatus Thermokryptus mobilis TaxID=1643428 RepID=A0A0S4MS29_9BACT|nr:pyruvate kinase [Candidatus Thermokryptus mobilis]CUU00783.1 pyruvate kinase [Candidatus Thermokryptus mobilis]
MKKFLKEENFRRTKIVCTLGPATNTLEKIIELINAGMDIARLNFSHGDYDDHLNFINLVRKASEITGKHISILQDLQGPKIRVGRLKNEPIELKIGELIYLASEQVEGNGQIIPIQYEYIAEDVKPGDTILLDDGLIELKVIEIKSRKVKCEVVDGGLLKSHKGVNLPGVNVRIPSLTEKDVQDLKFGIENGVDMVALSFVRRKKDVLDLLSKMEEFGKTLPVIAKIERVEAIKSIDEIIDISDGIMIARGDLGVELPTEDVPILQKMLIKKANKLGKPVITATQMLESMVSNPRPTRAEATDVANAVLDGTDAVMLSSETSIGEFPIESVKMMDKIIRTAETQYKFYEPIFDPNLKLKDEVDAIGRAACLLAQQLNAKAIVTITHTGATAKAIAKYRPYVPIIALTDSEEVVKRLNLVWGVISVKIKEISETDKTIETAKEQLKESKILNKGDLVIMTAGIPLFKRGSTNMIEVEKI